MLRVTPASTFTTARAAWTAGAKEAARVKTARVREKQRRVEKATENLQKCSDRHSGKATNLHEPFGVAKREKVAQHPP